jgi:sodium transport system permease protein
MIFTLFKKELKETLRDRRTILMMIIIPTLVFPVIMTLFMSISEGFQKEIASKNVKIGVISPKNSLFDKDLAQLPNQLGKKTFIQFNDTATLIKAIKNDSIQLGFVIPQNTDETLKKLKTVSIKVFHNGSDLGMKERAEVFLTYIQEKWTQQRLVNLEISQEKITPLQVNYENIASSKEMIGKLAGGFLPYMFIAFGFMGCMFPAIDLFTGEKERMTIETLLTTPVSRWKILVGSKIMRRIDLSSEGVAV